MTSVIDKIRKRRFYPVELENGETVHVRPMRWERQLAMDTLTTPEERVVYGLACGLVEEGGEQSFPIEDTESPAEYVARVRLLTTELTYADVRAITNAISKVTKPPSVDTVAKNSEPTVTAAS